MKKSNKLSTQNGSISRDYKHYRYIEAPSRGLGEIMYYFSRMGKPIREIYPSPNNKDCHIIVIDK